MNSISSASSTRVAESLAYIGGSADALALQEATHYYMADKIRDSLKQTLINSGNIIQNLLQFNNLKNRVSEFTSGSSLAVTPELIKNTLGDKDKLKNLFLNDGPKLGSNLADSEDLLDELLALGLAITAPLAVPVLITSMDKDGKVLSSNFVNMSQSERLALNSFNEISAQSFASKVHEQVIPPANKDGNSITFRYEVFDNFANLRPQKNDIDQAKIFLADKASALSAQFSKQLTTVLKTGEKLESLIDSNLKNTKEQSIRVSESQVLLQQVVVDLLYKLRQIKIDSEIRAPDNNSVIVKLGLTDNAESDILAMIKNMSDRVESVSSLQKNGINASEVNSNLNASSVFLNEPDFSNLTSSILKTDVNTINPSAALTPVEIKESDLLSPSLPGLRGDLPSSDNLREVSSDKKISDISISDLNKIDLQSVKD